jgi:7-cyano-7-deazaguanine synthase in queuosine biosynthesis
MNRQSRKHYGLDLRVVENDRAIAEAGGEESLSVLLGKDLAFDSNRFEFWGYKGWKSVHNDLLCLCAAVEFADRSCRRRASVWSRSFKLTLPVNAFQLWNQPKVHKQVRETLCFLTGDDWSFEFVESREKLPALGQMRFPFEEPKEFVMAYSDGLDSRCVSTLYGPAGIRVQFSNRKSPAVNEELPFSRLPFAVKLHTQSSETGVRSRGFKFAILAAIAAHISGVTKIIVPESGQGALGPVVVPLHNVYADYRNYPTFFRRIEAFIRTLLEHSVEFVQPRLWHTKAQTVLAALDVGASREALTNTRSCWQQRRNARVDGTLKQCGLCGACLLRRMSFLSANVDEDATSYAISNLFVARYEDAKPGSHRGWQESQTMIEYGCIAVRQMQRLAAMSWVSDQVLRPYVFELASSIGLSEVDTLDKLRGLLSQHAREWSDFLSMLGRHSFVSSWARGVRYVGTP